MAITASGQISRASNIYGVLWIHFFIRKMLVLKTLWQIVLSDDKSGIYESNLIRRICGLLYIPDKISGEIKLSIMNKNK